MRLAVHHRYSNQCYSLSVCIYNEYTGIITWSIVIFLHEVKKLILETRGEMEKIYNTFFLIGKKFSLARVCVCVCDT